MAARNQKNEAKLARIARAIFRALRRKKVIRTAKDPAVRIALAPNDELKRLKKKFLHRSVKIVDVLAFPEPSGFPHPESGTPPIGEVLLNEDIARDDFPRAVFLLVHGILHLLGYRHGKKRDTIVMEKLEKEVLSEVSHLSLT